MNNVFCQDYLGYNFLATLYHQLAWDSLQVARHLMTSGGE